MPSPEFNPRRAALQHAANAEVVLEGQSFESHDARVLGVALGESVHAVACGLVYVGDQIAAANERPMALQLVLPNAQAVTAWRAMDEPDEDVLLSPIVSGLVDALGRIARHDGSGPQDNEIREIARDALRKVGLDG